MIKNTPRFIPEWEGERERNIRTIVHQPFELSASSKMTKMSLHNWCGKADLLECNSSAAKTQCDQSIFIVCIAQPNYDSLKNGIISIGCFNFCFTSIHIRTEWEEIHVWMYRMMFVLCKKLTFVCVELWPNIVEYYENVPVLRIEICQPISLMCSWIGFDWPNHLYSKNSNIIYHILKS